tara:strand:+ start:766 stop:1059 length:294 start_codon:yes stop_codon:yes gene_type:complete
LKFIPSRYFPLADANGVPSSGGGGQPAPVNDLMGDLLSLDIGGGPQPPPQQMGGMGGGLDFLGGGPPPGSQPGYPQPAFASGGGIPAFPFASFHLPY